MKETVENEKIAEIKKLLEIAYVETMYESLGDTAGFIRAAVDSLKFDNRLEEETTPTGIVVEFTQRKSV